ncbi:hypothetical protein DIPPA_02153 [Diplonema papillatum]|nr:hypothetical protein DIPPA_02153 [Diplonema papillatum]
MAPAADIDQLAKGVLHLSLAEADQMAMTLDPQTKGTVPEAGPLLPPDSPSPPAAGSADPPAAAIGKAKDVQPRKLVLERRPAGGWRWVKRDKRKSWLPFQALPWPAGPPPSCRSAGGASRCALEAQEVRTIRTGIFSHGEAIVFGEAYLDPRKLVESLPVRGA